MKSLAIITIVMLNLLHGGYVINDNWYKPILSDIIITNINSFPNTIFLACKPDKKYIYPPHCKTIEGHKSIILGNYQENTQIFALSKKYFQTNKAKMASFDFLTMPHIALKDFFYLPHLKEKLLTNHNPSILHSKTFFYEITCVTPHNIILTLKKLKVGFNNGKVDETIVFPINPYEKYQTISIPIIKNIQSNLL